MFHPLESNLSSLKDSEVEEKLLELNRKYFQAARLGNHSLLTQISTFVTIYKEELSRRNRQKLQSQMDNDLDQLINVDRK
jgi:hypothetical protein